MVVIGKRARRGLTVGLGFVILLWAISFRPLFGATPTILALSPTSASPLTLVRIKGNNFSPLTAENTVMVGGIVAPSRTLAENLIEFLVPEGLASGPQRVTVITRGVASSPAILTLTEPSRMAVLAGLTPVIDFSRTPWQGMPLPRSALQFRISVGGEVIFPGTVSPFRGLIPPLFGGMVSLPGLGIGSGSTLSSLYAGPLPGRIPIPVGGQIPDLSSRSPGTLLAATTRGVVRVENAGLTFFPFPAETGEPLFPPTFIPNPSYDLRLPISSTNPLVTDSILVLTEDGLVLGPPTAMQFIPLPPEAGFPLAPPIPERNPQFSIAPQIMGSAQPFLPAMLIATTGGLVRLAGSKLTFTALPKEAGRPIGPPAFECNTEFSPRFGESDIGTLGQPFPFTARILLPTTRGVVAVSSEGVSLIPLPPETGKVLSPPTCLVNPSFTISSPTPTTETVRFFQPGFALSTENGLVLIQENAVSFIPLPNEAGRVLSPPLPLLNPRFTPFIPLTPLGGTSQPFLEGIVVTTTQGLALFRGQSVSFIPLPDAAGQVVAPPTFALNSSFDPTYDPSSPRGAPFPFSDELTLTTTGGIVRFRITSLAMATDSAQDSASPLAEPEFLPFPSGTGFPLAAAIGSTLPGGKTTMLVPASNGLVTMSDTTVMLTPVPEGAGSVLGPPSLSPSGAILLPVANGLVRLDQGTSQFIPLPQESGSVIGLPLDISPTPSSLEVLLATTNGYAIVRPSGMQFLPLPTGSGENIPSFVGLARALAANQPPRAEAGSDRTVEAGVDTLFDASASEDPDGTIVSYFWDFGDGTTATGRIVTHSFTTVGIFTVTLTVRDDDGATATDQLRVTVVDTTAPTVKVLSPTASDIVPAGGTLTIRWSSFDTVGVVRHDILLAVDGVNFTVSIATNLSGFAQSFDWSVPGTLQTNTARIRVVARDGSGNIGQGDSPLFIIRDTQPPSVTILSPVGGETVSTGGSLLVRWISSDNVGVTLHTVLLAPDGAQFTTALASALPGTTQEFLWLVPTSLVTASARIRVVARDAAGNEGAGESGFFTIRDTIAPTVTVTSPVKGQALNAGGTLTIRWQSTDNVGVVVQDILLSTDGGASFPTTIASGLSGKQTSFFWTIPANLITSSARIRILARDAAGNVGEGESGTFTIRDATPPTVIVTRPRTNEIVNPGTSFTIAWDSSDNVGVISHDILLSLNAGRNFSITIISGLSGDVRSFDWTVPGNIETNQARIRVVAYDAFGNAGFDDTGNFIIRDTLPPTVSILAPRTGQTVNPGTVFTIRWASSDNVRVLSHDIHFSTNGGQSYTSLATDISGTDQEYAWNVPLVTTTQARLRITARDAAGLVGVAETGNFTIRDTLGPSVTVLQPRVGQSVSPGTTLTIQWTSSDNLGVTSHEIRFSSNGCVSFPTTIVTGLPGSQQSYLWNIPADINTTRACVRVIARDAAGNIGQDDSGLFSIRDTVNPSVMLLHPTGGETFAGGSQVTVRWSSSDNIAVASQDLLFSTNGGATFSPIVTGLSGSEQSFSWTVPNNLTTSRAQIRVIARDAAGNTGQATSGNFTIADVTPPQVTVTRPGAGDSVQAGRSTTIRWTSADNIGVVAHDIQLSTNGGASFAITVATNLPGTQQSFTWNVPAEVITNQAVIRVIARDASGNSGQGESGIFVIQPPPMPPTVRLLAPNGGEIIQAGSGFAVRWASSDDRGIASHDLLLSTDGGQSFPIAIQTGLPGSAQSFAWSVPSTLATTRARIRVIARDTDGLTAQDDSDADFTIERPPAPPGDQLLVASDDVTIVAGLPSRPTVFATIPTRGNTRRVAVAPNGEFALAVNSDSTVSLISDLSNNPRETRLITVGQGPTAIAISSDATFAVTVNGEGLPLTLSLLRDLTTTPSVRTVPLGTTPSFAGGQDVALSRSGDLAFIPISAGVLVIEGLRSRPFPTVRTIIPIVQGTPTSIALSPDEATAYVTTTSPDQIVVIRGISGARPSVAARVTTGLGRSPRAVRLTPDGRRLLVTNSSSNDISIYRVEGEDLTLVARLSVGSRPTAIALSPDGTFAVVAHSGDRTLSIIENIGGAAPTVNPQLIGPAPELATDRNAVQSLAFLPR